MTVNVNAIVFLLLPVLVGLFPLGAFFIGAFLSRSRAVPKLLATRIAAAGGGLGFPVGIALGVLAGIGVIDVRTGIAGALIALAPALVLLRVGARARRYPRINDITTDVGDPPEFIHVLEIPEHKGRSFAYSDKSRALVPKWYPDLKTVTLPGSPDDVFDRARRTAHAMPQWAIAAADPKTRTVEASQESRLFGYVDDIVVRIRAAPGGQGSLVDVRSKSRDGIGDLGANAARIRAYLARLQSPI